MSMPTTYFFALAADLDFDLQVPAAQDRIAAISERKKPFRSSRLLSVDFAQILQTVGIGNGMPSNQPLAANESFVLERFDASDVRRFRNVPASEIHALLGGESGEGALGGAGVELWHWIVDAYEDGAELYLLTEF